MLTKYPTSKRITDKIRSNYVHSGQNFTSRILNNLEVYSSVMHFYFRNNNEKQFEAYFAIQLRL